MKKCFVIGLIMALMPQYAVVAAQKTVEVLIAEKQAKMKKLEKCKGTTKDLKIAGISTLGITAVGVGANIAEAVVLDDYKTKVDKEKKELVKQQELQKSLKDKANEKALATAAAEAEERSIKQFCDSLGVSVAPWGHECFNVISDEVQFADIADKLKAFNSNCNMLTFHAIGQDIERAVGKYPIATALCGNNIVVNFQFTNLKCPDGQEFGFDSNRCVDKPTSEPKAEAEEKAEENSNPNGEANIENDNKDSDKDIEDDDKDVDKDTKDDKDIEDNNKEIDKDVEADNDAGDASSQQCGNGQKLIDGKCQDNDVDDLKSKLLKSKPKAVQPKAKPKTCNPACANGQECKNGTCVDTPKSISDKKFECEKNILKEWNDTTQNCVDKEKKSLTIATNYGKDWYLLPFAKDICGEEGNEIISNNKLKNSSNTYEVVCKKGKVFYVTVEKSIMPLM